MKGRFKEKKTKIKKDCEHIKLQILHILVFKSVLNFKKKLNFNLFKTEALNVLMIICKI